MEALLRRIVLVSITAFVAGNSLKVIRRDGYSADLFYYEGSEDYTCDEFGGTPSGIAGTYKCMCIIGASIATNVESESETPSCYRDAGLLGKGCAPAIYDMRTSEGASVAALECAVSSVLVWTGRRWQNETQLISRDVLLDDQSSIVKVSVLNPSVGGSLISGHIMKLEMMCGAAYRCAFAKVVGLRNYTDILLSSDESIKTPVASPTPGVLSISTAIRSASTAPAPTSNWAPSTSVTMPPSATMLVPSSTRPFSALTISSSTSALLPSSLAVALSTSSALLPSTLAAALSTSSALTLSASVIASSHSTRLASTPLLVQSVSTTVRQSESRTATQALSGNWTTTQLRSTRPSLPSTRDFSTLAATLMKVTSPITPPLQTTSVKPTSRPVVQTTISTISRAVVAKTTVTLRTQLGTVLATSSRAMPAPTTPARTEEPERREASVNVTTVIAATVPSVCCVVVVLIFILFCMKRKLRKELTGKTQAEEAIENTYASVYVNNLKPVVGEGKKRPAGPQCVSQPIYFAAEQENFYHQVDAPSLYAVAEQPVYRELDGNYCKDSGKSLQSSCDGQNQYEPLNVDDGKNLYEQPSASCE